MDPVGQRARGMNLPKQKASNAKRDLLDESDLPAVGPGVAVPLFDTNVTGFFPYDVTPDGRFLINTVTEAATPNCSPITVVLNWTAALKK
jgi:hypothetical protein